MQLSHAHSIRSYPAIGEPFELGFDGDYKNNQPLELVRQAGYAPIGWAHNGSLIEGRKIFICSLVSLDAILTFDKVRDKLTCYGELPAGQLISGFKVMFPRSDGKGPIGIADASWWAPDGRIRFPSVGRGGGLSLNRAFGTFGPGWRWIIVEG